jgi:endonuclease/exonuclease/phosphatase family metal-dependent hydrolase
MSTGCKGGLVAPFRFASRDRGAPRALATILLAAVFSAGCETRAPAASGPPPAAPAAPSPAASLPAASLHRLVVATWNIAWLNRAPGEGEIPRREADYQRLARYAERIDADVVALQEIDGADAARLVFDPARYDFHFTSDEDYVQRDGFAIRRGIPFTPNPDVVALAVGGTRRGADVTIHLAGIDLRILSLHLKTGCWDDALDTDSGPCRILARQLPVLEDWIDARAREGTPFAVLGDFNRRFEAPDRFWPEIDDGDPPGARLTDAVAGVESRCWNGEYPRFVDHLVFGALASAWIAPGSLRQMLFDPGDAHHKRTLSDHCPVAVTLDLPAPAIPRPVAR